MFEKGLPQGFDISKLHFIKSERNIKVTINNSLDWMSVNSLLKNIHYHESQQKFWEVPLYCKPIRNLIPVKVQPKIQSPEKVVVNSPDILRPSTSQNITSEKNKSFSAVKQDQSVQEYEFSDLVVQKTPISDANQKRKVVSPAEQGKTKKKRGAKEKN